MRIWVIPAALIVALEYIVAIAVGLGHGFPYAIAVKNYLIAGLTAAVLSFFCIVAFRLARRDFEKPLPLYVVPGCVLVSLQWAVVMWLKMMLPVTVGFWADPVLAELEPDPWRFAHLVFGWADSFIDRAYVSWAPLKFAILLPLVLSPESRKKTVALIAYFLFGSTCSLMQYVLPSAGPVFYEAMGHGTRFTEIPLAPWVESTRHYLWLAYLEGGGKVGAGISAFPSVHVAAALWMALVVRSFAPQLQALAWIFYSLILVGSVYLGWHYALDGIAGTIITMGAWRVSHTFVEWSMNRGSREVGRPLLSGAGPA